MRYASGIAGCVMNSLPLENGDRNVTIFKIERRIVGNLLRRHVGVGLIGEKRVEDCDDVRVVQDDGGVGNIGTEACELDMLHEWVVDCKFMKVSEVIT